MKKIAFLIIVGTTILLSGCKNSKLDNKIKCKTMIDKATEYAEKECYIGYNCYVSRLFYSEDKDTCLLEITNKHSDYKNLWTTEIVKLIDFLTLQELTGYTCSNTMGETNKKCVTESRKYKQFVDLIDGYHE